MAVVRLLESGAPLCCAGFLVVVVVSVAVVLFAFCESERAEMNETIETIRQRTQRQSQGRSELKPKQSLLQATRCIVDRPWLWPTQTHSVI